MLNSSSGKSLHSAGGRPVPSPTLTETEQPVGWSELEDSKPVLARAAVAPAGHSEEPAEFVGTKGGVDMETQSIHLLTTTLDDVFD